MPTAQQPYGDAKFLQVCGMMEQDPKFIYDLLSMTPGNMDFESDSKGSCHPLRECNMFNLSEDGVCSKKTLTIVIVLLLMALLTSIIPGSQGSHALLGAEQCSKSDNCIEQLCGATCTILALNAIGDMQSCWWGLLLFLPPTTIDLHQHPPLACSLIHQFLDSR
jgi:hypothetical protein